MEACAALLLVRCEVRLPPPFLLFSIFTGCLARQVIKACEAKGVHGFKVAFPISSQIVNTLHVGWL